jgi:hypothetical protein
MLTINHNAGFCSCADIRLTKIINYFNINKELPKTINCANTYNLYKSQENVNKDVMHLWYDIDISMNIHYSHNIDIINSKLFLESQFSDYKCINFNELKPFVNKYFLPSQIVRECISKLEDKYISKGYNNTCGIFYRNGDKRQETDIPSYDDIINKANELYIKNPDIQFIILSIDDNFISAFRNKFNNSLVITEPNTVDKTILNSSANIPNYIINYIQNNMFEHSIYFLASIILISKMDHIIFNSSNISFWITLYRGNAHNIHQYLKHKEYIYNIKNSLYNPDNNANHWY